jgi:hypothetical protein
MRDVKTNVVGVKVLAMRPLRLDRIEPANPAYKNLISKLTHTEKSKRLSLQMTIYQSDVESIWQQLLLFHSVPSNVSLKAYPLVSDGLQLTSSCFERVCDSMPSLNINAFRLLHFESQILTARRRSSSSDVFSTTTNSSSFSS